MATLVSKLPTRHAFQTDDKNLLPIARKVLAGERLNFDDGVALYRSGDILAVNQGTLYPLLLKLENEGSIVSEWGASENNRRARFYRLTATGRKQLREETRDWEQTAAIIARFFEVKAEDLS